LVVSVDLPSIASFLADSLRHVNHPTLSLDLLDVSLPHGSVVLQCLEEITASGHDLSPDSLGSLQSDFSFFERCPLQGVPWP
jgi:hypothetical protein